VFFLRSKQQRSRPIVGKIEIFSRHCIFSEISKHKKRYQNYSREKCLQNLFSTFDRSEANITFILDAKDGNHQDHFLSSYPHEKVIPIQRGSEAGAFLSLLDYIASLSLHPDTLIYIVEDDYYHRPGWIKVMREGFSLHGVDYVTLYDLQDKYCLPMYRKLMSRILLTPSSHWRTTPSTTNTFAVHFQTLMDDLSVHRKFSQNCVITEDHRKFCQLNRKGRVLISPIPGWSTHCDPENESPCVNWNVIANSSCKEHGF
jgi:hypothetical protein